MGEHVPADAGLSGATAAPAENFFVRIYRLPLKLTNGFCMAGAVPITFANVDWFEVMPGMSREDLVKFCEGKRYFNPDASYLVLADDPAFTFTFGQPVRR